MANEVSQDTLQTKHRPQSWDAVIGQEHITSILRGIIKNETWRYTRSYVLAGCVVPTTKIHIRRKKKNG